MSDGSDQRTFSFRPSFPCNRASTRTVRRGSFDMRSYVVVRPGDGFFVSVPRSDGAGIETGLPSAGYGTDAGRGQRLRKPSDPARRCSGRISGECERYPHRPSISKRTTGDGRSGFPTRVVPCRETARRWGVFHHTARVSSRRPGQIPPSRAESRRSEFPSGPDERGLIGPRSFRVFRTDDLRFSLIRSGIGNLLRKQLKRDAAGSSPSSTSFCVPTGFDHGR